MGECMHPETKLCKESSYMWISWCHQESTWVTVPSSNSELECLDDKFSVVYSVRTLLTRVIVTRKTY